ncbi:hypothetical protein WN51_12777 [Melipona quadrifasciata]|uniref:Uncharacterized protein n=1 Tax=Melipona quadrifasciata TaxID=166423 RepID=A0A0N0BH20_9HYME|nr:hypothetical protein WN51_12777 [Melipona quadrifasciata]
MLFFMKQCIFRTNFEQKDSRLILSSLVDGICFDKKIFEYFVNVYKMFFQELNDRKNKIYEKLSIPWQ